MSLRSLPPDLLLVVAVVALALALTQALVGAWRRWSRRWRTTRRMKRAALGEQRALAWLEERGFRVLGAQVCVEHPVAVDGRVVKIALRADYLAERDGARYVVEVKTGALAPRIETSATRRQILEYRVAFDVDGVVLVDGETGRVCEITFPALERFERPSRVGRVVAVVLAAAAAAIALLYVSS